MKNHKNFLSRGLQHLAWLAGKRSGARHLLAREGSVITEFALIAPILLVLILGIVDFGKIISDKVSLNGALEAGTLYASKNSSDTSGIQSAVLNATNLTGVTVTTTQYCECADGSRPSCTASCSDASQLATYVSITASVSVTTLMTYPGVANPYPLSITTRVRVQ